MNYLNQELALALKLHNDHNFKELAQWRGEERPREEISKTSKKMCFSWEAMGVTNLRNVLHSL